MCSVRFSKSFSPLSCGVRAHWNSSPRRSAATLNAQARAVSSALVGRMGRKKRPTKMN
jgi:hypothetical protein